MPTERESQAPYDQPEPEEALAGTAARTPDHPPSPQDDREVPLDDPEQTVPPIDDEDRDPAGRQPGDGI